MSRQHEPIDKRLRERLRKQREEHCPLCDGKLGPILYEGVDHLHPLAFSADHITPLARGGTKHFANLQATHRRCNRLKSDSMPGDVPGTPRPSTTRSSTTSTRPSTSCPPGLCTKCRGTHNPRPGVEFVTARRWTP